MDAARSAKRLGGDVTIVYRRTQAELPARKEEVEHAMEEGIKFCFLTNPTEILGDDKCNCVGIRCIRMELGEPDASGRRRPVEVAGSEHDIEADQLIMALGTSPNPLIKSTTEGLETQRWGGIIINEETGEISRVPRVVLIDVDGKAYQATSVGMFNVIKNAYAVFGQAPWTPPLKMHIKQKAVKNGSMLTATIE